jgi:hypothetical protein
MSVLVTISTEARAFVEQFSQREELDLMIDRALDEATADIPAGVILWTHRDDVGTDDDPTKRSWIEWMAATFPPAVCENFVLLPVYRANGR